MVEYTITNIFLANETDRPGVVASFSCDLGYGFIGAKSATCNSAGHWNYANGAPVCIGKALTNYSFTIIGFLYIFFNLNI